jgi:hypothetical protein
MAATKGGTRFGRQSLDQHLEAGQAVLGGVGLATLDLHVQHQAQIAHPVGMQGMARAAWLGGVVADLRAGLMTVEQLDAAVDIENPGVTQGFAHAFGKSDIHPGRALRQLRRAGRLFGFGAPLGRRGGKMRQGPAQAFVADDLLHAQYRRRDFVASQSGYMSIAPLPVQDRQQPGAQHVRHARRIGAGVGHLAGFPYLFLEGFAYRCHQRLRF